MIELIFSLCYNDSRKKLFVLKKIDNSVCVILLAGIILTVAVLMAGCFDSPRFYDVLQSVREESVVSLPPLIAEKNKIDINSADIDELQKLYGIGKARAQAIIDYRKNNGGFFAIDELVNISGISEKIIEKNKNLITLGEYTGVYYEKESY